MSKVKVLKRRMTLVSVILYIWIIITDAFLYICRVYVVVKGNLILNTLYKVRNGFYINGLFFIN